MNYFKNYTQKNKWIYLMAFVLEFIAMPAALWLKIRQIEQVYGIDSRKTEWTGSQLKTLLMNQHKKTVFVTAFASSLLLYFIPLLTNIVSSSIVAVIYSCFHYELLLGYCLTALTYICVFQHIFCIWFRNSRRKLEFH